jgi:hypothetical protein
MNGQQTLALIVERALDLGASSCYLLMRQGVGQIVFIVGNTINKVSTISPKVFADCNAVLLPYLQLPGGQQSHVQSGMMGFRSKRGPVQVVVRSFQHIEPVLSLQFTPDPPTPVSFAQLNMSVPASLAIRQYLESGQKLMYVIGDNAASNQIVFSQAMYGVLGLFSRTPIVYSGQPLPAMLPDIKVTDEITQETRQSLLWPDTVVLSNNFTPTSGTTLSYPPLPAKVIVSSPYPSTLSGTIGHTMETLHLFADPRGFLPALSLYVQAMPRLCFRCRKSLSLNVTDYEWLQKKLSGVVERNYTVIEQAAPAGMVATEEPEVTPLKDLKVVNLLDMIAKDPGMVNRSADDKVRQKNAIKTVQVWQGGRQPDCPVCHGSGYDGYVLASGFAELDNTVLVNPTELKNDEVQLRRRFWVDVFEKGQQGLIPIDHIAKLAVEADQSGSPDAVTAAIPIPVPIPIAHANTQESGEFIFTHDEDKVE